MKSFLEEITNLNDVTNWSKKLQKFEDLETLSNEQIEEIFNILNIDSFIFETLEYEVLKDLCFKLLNAFEERCSKIIEDKTSQKKIEVGTKVKVKYDFKGEKSLMAGNIATITKVIRFEEDTFGQGWYIFELDDYFRVYSYEFEVI